MSSTAAPRPEVFPQYTYIGSLHGLRYLRTDGGDWRLVSSADDPDIVALPADLIDEETLRAKEHFRPA